MINTSRISHILFTACPTRSLVFASILMIGLFASAGSLAQAGPPPAVVDQYTEQVPSPGGATSPNGSTQPDPVGSTRPGDGVDDGQAGFAGNSGGGLGGSGGARAGERPYSAGGTSKPSSGEGESASSASEAGSSQSGSSAVDGIVEEGGGMGIFFPLILIASLMVAFALVFMRRKGDSELDRSHSS